MSTIDYNTRIPNNVGLTDDRRLRRALEAWQPAYIDWWKEMGPVGLQTNDIYLRTAVSVEREGWAHYDYVKMPDYRWGIFLEPSVPNRRIGFGDHYGEPVWKEVPGEYRAPLRRILAVQGDTEPASVEQQRHLGSTCPSLYDLRNLLQVNVEEGRHLWAMVYLLHAHFGRDGREEAQRLLQRRSGHQDRPRILGAFNETTADWLAFFMFTYFTDRDGKYQLCALAESAFDPLARTCRFMIKEEAHHMFVGDSGVSRIVKRSCEVIRDNPFADPRTLGVIDLDTIQRHINFHHSVTLDLFGAEISTNAANAFTIGLKGRFQEDSIRDDHRLDNALFPVNHYEEGIFTDHDIPARNALNDRLRKDFIADVDRGVKRWNQIIAAHDIHFELKLPHSGFNRRIGVFSGIPINPDGVVLSQEQWLQQEHEWLPTETDKAFLHSLMNKPITEPGQFANWIAPPARGINHQPIEFDYVRSD